jgi:hypothetical protein
MKELIKKGYTKEGNLYIKPYGEYRITLFPSKDTFLRRITRNGEVLEMKRVFLQDVEKGKIMEVILKDMALDTQRIPNPPKNVKENNEQRLFPKKSKNGNIV